MAEKVRHIGKISKINHDSYEVHIVSVSACAGCANRTSCGTADVKDKLIIVPKTQSEQYFFQEGDDVEVLIEQKKAFLAILLSYFFPAVLLIVALFISIKYFSETVAALVALGIIGIYFLLFLLMKPYLNKKFRMYIQPLGEPETAFYCSDNPEDLYSNN